MPRFFILGVDPDHIGPPALLLKKGCFRTFVGDKATLKAGRSYRNAIAAERFIKAEKEAGSNWVYALWPAWVE